jgi:glycosyltransferase involved in cell wall biosynthesis
MIRVCVSAQSPPISPLVSKHEGVWRRGIDYEQSVGGLPVILSGWRQSKWLERNGYLASFAGDASWPDEIQTEDFRAIFAKPPEEYKERYLKFDDAVWRTMHDTGPLEVTNEDYVAFDTYSARMADRLMDVRKEVDVYWANDFQQVQLGSLLYAPSVLCWHIPMRIGEMEYTMREFYIKNLEKFGGVIVYTMKDLRRLEEAGFNGRAYQVYPPAPKVKEVQPEEVQVFRQKWNLGENPTFVCVARFDEMKRQDLLLKAFAVVSKTYPLARLMFVGNGKFSTGLAVGRTKARMEQMRELANELKIEDKVRFTGHLTHEEVQKAYAASVAFVLPSPLEGFGVVGLEAWIQKKPVIVTDGSGMSELVTHGINGLVAEAGSVKSLADNLLTILQNENRAADMGIQGSVTARQCDSTFISEQMRKIFEEVIDGR